MNAPLLPGFGAPALVPMDSPIIDRDRILADLQKRAGKRFMEQAAKAVLDYLYTHGEAPGEVITDAVKARGITPPAPMDDRAFGAVYRQIARLGVITILRSVPRTKGHGCAGGNVWGLVKR